MIKYKVTGEYKKLNSFFAKIMGRDYISDLDKYGKEGVELLKNATPVDTGKTSESWRYEIEKKDGTYRINFLNDNIVRGCNVAVLIQYGHATVNGGFVEGVDYINPALKPLFERLAENAWKEVSAL